MKFRQNKTLFFGVLEAIRRACPDSSLRLQNNLDLIAQTIIAPLEAGQALIMNTSGEGFTTGRDTLPNVQQIESVGPSPEERETVGVDAITLTAKSRRHHENKGE